MFAKVLPKTWVIPLKIFQILPPFFLSHCKTNHFAIFFTKKQKNEHIFLKFQWGHVLQTDGQTSLKVINRYKLFSFHITRYIIPLFLSVFLITSPMFIWKYEGCEDSYKTRKFTCAGVLLNLRRIKGIKCEFENFGKPTYFILNIMILFHLRLIQKHF